MKKYLLSIVCILGTLIMMQSCVKEVHQSEIIKEVFIDTTITAGSDYVLDLAPFGKDDDIATILEPGNLFSISQLEDVTDMLTSVYHYKSSTKTSGTDKVVIAISKNPMERRQCSKDSTIIYLNLTIK